MSRPRGEEQMLGRALAGIVRAASTTSAAPEGAARELFELLTREREGWGGYALCRNSREPVPGTIVVPVHAFFIFASDEGVFVYSGAARIYRGLNREDP